MESLSTGYLEGVDITQEMVLFTIFLLFTVTVALAVIGINLLLIGAT